MNRSYPGLSDRSAEGASISSEKKRRKRGRRWQNLGTEGRITDERGCSSEGTNGRIGREASGDRPSKMAWDRVGSGGR
jgi:hypothetical protein